MRKGLETEWNEVIPRGGSKVVPSNAKSWFIWRSVEFRTYDSLPDETVIDDNNIDKALKRVVGNCGAPGVDFMDVSELEPWLELDREFWS